MICVLLSGHEVDLTVLIVYGLRHNNNYVQVQASTTITMRNAGGRRGRGRNLQYTS